MLQFYQLTQWLNGPLIRAHLCTLAVAMCFNSTWRAPRLALRLGGLTYGLVLTAAIATVALPLTLLQLAIGQLSQQDAVGVWRAVPFFRGVGCIRILISFIGTVYSVVYLALTITYFVYTLSNSIPFTDCIDVVNVLDGGEVNATNGSTCLNQTFLSPILENPEYYLAISSIVAVLWIAFPFMFYNPVKFMKRIFYVLSPLVVILMAVILANIGNRDLLYSFVRRNDWQNFLEPEIWHAAVAQAFLSSQLAGGYMISAADSVYANTNVKWTTLGFVSAQIAASWFGLVFWFSVSGGRGDERDTSVVAVLINTYQLALDPDITIVWALLVFTALLLSGLITVVALVYPVYERTRRAGGMRWRAVAAVVSVVGAGASLATLAGRLPALTLLDDVAVPLLASLATVLEILPFVFVYGWRVLLEDLEFLTGEEVAKYWVWGWWIAPGVVAPLLVWWCIDVVGTGGLAAVTLIAALAGACFLLLVAAALAVARQVNYDLLTKLKSSFSPARQWGPRDPITHYYWLARREELERGDGPGAHWHRRQLGQLSGRSRFNNVSEKPATDDQHAPDVKKRSNSDDWLFTVYRKEYIANVCKEYMYKNKRRSKSFDWSGSNKRARIFDVSKKKLRFTLSSEYLSSSRECNNALDVKVDSYTEYIVK